MLNLELLENKEISNNTLCVAALIKRGNAVLMGLREYEKGKPVWTLPGGRCDAGESLKETLLREIEEEIGVSDVEILDIIGEKAGVHHGDKVYFIECSISQEPKLMEPEKFLEWSWIEYDKLPPNLIDPTDIEFIEKIFKKK